MPNLTGYCCRGGFLKPPATRAFLAIARVGSEATPSLPLYYQTVVVLVVLPYLVARVRADPYRQLVGP